MIQTLMSPKAVRTGFRPAQSRERHETFQSADELECQSCGRICRTRRWDAVHQLWFGPCCEFPDDEELEATANPLIEYGSVPLEMPASVEGPGAADSALGEGETA